MNLGCLCRDCWCPVQFRSSKVPPICEDCLQGLHRGESEVKRVTDLPMQHLLGLSLTPAEGFEDDPRVTGQEPVR